MPQVQTMTLDEKLAISYKAVALWQAGYKERFSRVIRIVPMLPYLAKVAKENIGVDFLKNGGWNLLEVEAEFGRDWLSR